jgi:hypothetical protein
MAPALQGRQGDMKRNRNLRRDLKTRPLIPPLTPRLGFFELLVTAGFLKRDRRAPSLRPERPLSSHPRTGPLKTGRSRRPVDRTALRIAA